MEDVLHFEIGNCFCCECGQMYLYNDSKPLYGRTCTCVCLCDHSTLDEWYEIHMEITETCCTFCDKEYMISCSTWNYAQGKHDLFCSEKCELQHTNGEEYDSEDESEED